MTDTYDDGYIDDLFSNIKNSIINDVGLAINAYCSEHHHGNITSGFFAIPRLLLPEIDGMGAYITGNAGSTASNIENYLQKVMSKIDTRYSLYSKFISKIYRHGLLHQHEPKNCKYQGRDAGWSFMVSNPNNPIGVQRKYHLIENPIKFDKSVLDPPFILQSDMTLFYKDVVNSIEIMKKETKTTYRKTFYKARNEQLKTSILA